MPTMNSYQWEQERLGEHAVYPGHPVILACMVMDRYPSLLAARGTDQLSPTFGNALSDSFIPGAGCAVHAALDVLRYAQVVSVEAAYELAESYWHGWERQHPNNVPGAAKGREQCVRIKARFESMLKTWGTPEDPGSPYRVQLMTVIPTLEAIQALDGRKL